MRTFLGLVSLFATSFLMAACGPRTENASPLNRVARWFILLNYQEESHPLDPSEVACYQMAILDPDGHPDLSTLPSHLVKIGYVSVGEAESYRSYWSAIEGSDWIIGENPNWSENYFVDVSSAQWHQVILNTVIPALVEKGFQGIMLDTLDTVDYLAEHDPENAAKYKQGMINLVAAIQAEFPDLFLISNNGFTILNEIVPYLSGFLVEDIYWMPNFEDGGYMPVPEAWSEAKIDALTSLMESYELPVFDIEYLDPSQTQEIRQTRRKVKRLGFVPYIAQKDLDQFYPEGNPQCR